MMEKLRMCESDILFCPYPLPLGEGRVRVSGFTESCDPHPALKRRPLPEGEASLRANNAAPIMQASGHSFDCTIRQSANDGGNAYCLAKLAACPSNSSLDAMTPPPI